MARYVGPKCKLCRREGMKLFLKGPRCLSDKCAVVRRDYPPGQHAQRRSKSTDYSLRLREKQKLKRIYGILERQFQLTFREAERLPGNTGANLASLLERRLDSVVISAGFALSRNHARHLIQHGHFRVNDKWVDVPSILLRPGDVVTVRDKDSTRKLVDEAVEYNKLQTVPGWLGVDRVGRTARVNGMPSLDDFLHPIQLQLIIEIASR
ncbi:MAG TPA: 30S ribosomal protein S4 [Planctomycetota bacterium]|nr:30S ribosomal protein S4 [Planctomycetota bacterium]